MSDPVTLFLNRLLRGVATQHTQIVRDAWRELAALEQLDAAPLYPMHRQTITTLAQRLSDTPIGYVAHTVPVYVARDVPEPAQVMDDIAGWARMAGMTFDGVTRVSVIARHGDLQYLGCYDILYLGIILTWPVAASGPGLRWLRQLETEWAFYHEVGHHVCGHLEGGQVAEQEAEADAFASARFRQAHPMISGIGRAITWPLRRFEARLERTEARG